MRLAPPVLTCPLILIHVQTLIRLKPMAWFQQTWILQDIRLILQTTVMYPARHIISTYLLEIFVNHLDIIPRHHSSVSYDSSRNNNGLPYYAGHSSSQLLHYPTSSRSNSYQHDQRSVQLFDPENPQRPNPSLMTHYITVFFEQHGAEFTFLSFQDISTDFWDQRLSSILANCIAAMASQYVTKNLFK
jgi:hypothetical protein